MNSKTNSGSNGMSSRRSSKKKLQQFRNEVASSMNIDLKQGYNGDLTSREAGSIGGEMVKRMIAYAEDSLNGEN
ncbi:MAG: alpha/beta-type small acid-soluble spore protein [Clostridia bacterium]|nr:alpha/beta-type small acid-soluble spore protein [Clostridia bacterium]MBQ4447754.1 alpha/beta-type small acid-soluble spore protein [Clostridia bacterium]MBR3487441.1 alpha/beta-type small acid-soluble spore protein [Clostridia bacterium]